MGSDAMKYLLLHQQGDFTESTVVYLYDGDPEAGGKLIAETSAQQVPARSSREIEIEWLVGSEEKDSYHLYAFARPVDGVQEMDDNNN